MSKVSIGIKQKTNGFTVIELLVVVVVIGILAGIVLLSYNSWRTTTAQNEVKSSLNGLVAAMNSARTFGSGYPTSIPSTFTPNSDVTLNYAWGDSNGYCVSATSVAVPSVSYNINTYQSSTVQSGVCASIITNMVGDPSVETGGVPAGAAYYSAPLSIDSTNAAYGTNSLTTTTNSATNPQGMIWWAVSAQPNTQYTCSVSFKGTPGKVLRIASRAADGGGSYIGEGYGNSSSISMTSSWQRASVTFTSPANTGTIGIETFLTTAASGVNIWTDGAMCTQGSTVYNYKDGDQPNWVWNGSPSNSTSTGPGN